MIGYIILGCVGVIILFVIIAHVNAYFNLVSHKVMVHWDERHAHDKEIAEQKAKKKITQKYSQVYVGNPWLEMILKQYNIIVWGPLGSGKTLFGNLLCFYLCMKYAKEDRKNRRYNHYMRPDYERDLKKLETNKQIRVYSNIPLIDAEGNKSQELRPYLTQEKRFIWRGVIFTDEIGSNLGKDLYFSKDKNTVETERIVDMSRYTRQNCEIKWIGNEQSKDNIFKPIRDRGFTEVRAVKTITKLSKWGNFKRGFAFWWRLFLPGYLTTNVIPLFKKTLFTKDRVKLGFALLLPLFFLRTRDYYISKTDCNSRIKKKHTQLSEVIDFYGNELLFNFTNKEIFGYNSQGHEKQYLDQFNEEGNRKYE